MVFFLCGSCLSGVPFDVDYAHFNHLFQHPLVPHPKMIGELPDFEAFILSPRLCFWVVCVVAYRMVTCLESIFGDSAGFFFFLLPLFAGSFL